MGKMSSEEKFLKEVHRQTVSQRISSAKAVIRKLTDRVLDVIELSSVCEFFVYQDTLSKQIPESYAGHAFLATQDALFKQLVMRTVALWDKPNSEVVSIPTAVAWIDDDAVIHQLQDEVYEQHAQSGRRNLNPSKDPEIEAAIQKHFEAIQQNFGATQAEKAAHQLRACIEAVHEIEAEEVHSSIVNLRDHISHSLERTRREVRGPVAPMRYGDERALLDRSVRLIEDLYCWVNGASFDIQGDCVRKAKRNAAELWGGCTFSVKGRGSRPSE